MSEYWPSRTRILPPYIFSLYSVQQELEELFPSTRGGERGGERRLYKIDAGESSASTATDTNTSFAAPSATKRTIAEIWG